jgi:hypothetical protein
MRFFAILVAVLAMLVPSAQAQTLVHGVDLNGVGNAETLSYLQSMEEFENLNPKIQSRLWFDPYLGNDSTGTGTYSNPYRSFEKMIALCRAYTRCTTKGKDRVYSRLTLNMVTSADGTINEFDFAVGESLTWTASTGEVLDWDRSLRILVVLRLTGTNPTGGTRITGAGGAVWDQSGAAVNTVNPTADDVIDDGIPLACDDPNRICTLIDSEFPEHPARADGNWFALKGTTGNGVDDCGTLCTGGPSTGGWLAIQNFVVQNFASDSFSIQSGASSGKLLALRTQSINSRNGAENRSTSDATNNCYTTHAQGAMIVLADRGSRNRVDSAASAGSCVAPTGTNKFVMIGTSDIRSDSVAANNSAPISITGSDSSIYGHRFVANTTGVSVLSMSPGSTEKIDLKLYNVMLHQPSTNSFAVGVSFGNNGLTQNGLEMWNTSIIGQGRAFQLASYPGVVPRRILARGLMIDNPHYWIYAFDPSLCKIDLDIEGIFDDQDAGGSDANEFHFHGTDYATRAAAALRCRNWKLYERRSFDSNGASDGTQWGSDPVFRCQAGQLCANAWTTQFNSDIVIDFRNRFASSPEDSCLPEDVLGRRVCEIRYRPVHYGAR